MIIEKTVDLGTVQPRVERIDKPVFVGDKNALEFRFTLQNAVSPAVKVYAIRADGSTVVDDITESGGKWAVNLGSPYTAIPGRLQVVVKCLQGSTRITTIYAADMVVVNTTTDTIVDPSRVVPSLDELLAQIETISAATTAANTAAHRLDNMTIRGTVSDHFEVVTGTNAQGGIDVNILGGVGVKGDKGDKGDAGGVESVNGEAPDGQGNIALYERHIMDAPIFLKVNDNLTTAVADGKSTSVNEFTFPTPFPDGYTVFVYPYFTLGSARFAAAEAIAVNVTTTGFTARIANNSGASIDAGTGLNYFAIGYKEVTEDA